MWKGALVAVEREIGSPSDRPDAVVVDAGRPSRAPAPRRLSISQVGTTSTCIAVSGSPCRSRRIVQAYIFFGHDRAAGSHRSRTGPWAAMCLIGTTIINGVLKFDSLFNTVVNFSALFAGAYFANVLARSYQLPGIDSMVMVAISANAGMAVAALFLMIYYRTSFN
jgi:hypothetical protein